MNLKTPPQELLQHLVGSGTGERLFRPRDTDILPSDTGAYALILRLSQKVVPARPRGISGPLAQGWYVYAGSAHGPGGIRSRVARHMRRKKTLHWHIDQLTTQENVHVWAAPSPDAAECDLVASLTRTGRFYVPCPGFGSSDCKKCSAHLLAWRQSG